MAQKGFFCTTVWYNQDSIYQNVWDVCKKTKKEHDSQIQRRLVYTNGKAPLNAEVTSFNDFNTFRMTSCFSTVGPCLVTSTLFSVGLKARKIKAGRIQKSNWKKVKIIWLAPSLSWVVYIYIKCIFEVREDDSDHTELPRKSSESFNNCLRS